MQYSTCLLALFFKLKKRQIFTNISHISAHHAYVTRKSTIDKIALPEPTKLHGSCKKKKKKSRYEVDTEKSNASMQPTEDDKKFLKSKTT